MSLAYKKTEKVIKEREHRTKNGIINVKSIFINKNELSDVLLKLAEKRMKF